MEIIDKKSVLWNYLPVEIRGLFVDGETLLSHVEHVTSLITDYSYLVFPFSKGYEGFLKKFFLDMGFIRENEYYSDDIRIGRILNPHYVHEHTNVYKSLGQHQKGDAVLSMKLWDVWKKGRNEVFHYFPHNFKKLTYAEALKIIQEIAAVMSELLLKCDLIQSLP